MNTVLFDLDGTLVFMDQEEFVTNYISRLCRKAAPLGYDAQRLTAALWKGTGAMAKNDGKALNRQRFWDIFAGELGEQVRAAEPLFNEFYAQEFAAVIEVTKENPLAKTAINMLKQKGYTVALATNPFFPPVAVETRLNWVGLTSGDFAYITTYENSSYCKPNPGYFQEVLRALDKQPQECLMVGNNLREDMAAKDLRMHVYLVTDYLESKDHGQAELYPHGSFAEFYEYACSLPTLLA